MLGPLENSIIQKVGESSWGKYVEASKKTLYPIEKYADLNQKSPYEFNLNNFPEICQCLIQY